MTAGTGTLVRVTAPEQTDVELLAAMAAGDRDALAVLYHRHARWLLTRLHHRCTDPDIVDTALQDTFVSAWRSAGNYRADAGEVGAWLWAIAARRLVDQLRRRPAPTPTATLPEPEPLPPPGTPVYQLLAGLPADLHPVVRAVYVDGLTTAEAAILLGIPHGTVKSRLSRAKPLLKPLLRGELR